MYKRQLLNILELVVEADADAGTIVITDEKVTERLQQNPWAYDKDGETVSYTHLDVYKRQLHSSMDICQGVRAWMRFRVSSISR